MKTIKSSRLLPLTALFLACLALLSAGCRKAQTKDAPDAPVVDVAPVATADVPVYSEWIATTDGFVNATIRAQVQGYLVSRDYNEGDFVKKGQVLFRIDARPFQAALDQAKGRLAEVQARYETARANLERIKPLCAENAVSKKDLDDAVGAEQAGRAAVIGAKAAVDKARLDLGFTRICSPIDGIAGIARAQLGDLVGPGSVGDLTIVSTVNPIKVYVPMSEQEYLKYVQSHRTDHMPLELLLADGSTYPHKGSFAFADRSIDERTGTIKVAALFPNPGNVLRPGQFGKVRARTGTRKSALLVPQRAVTELQGGYQVAVIGAGNRVAMRPVRLAGQVESRWVVESGVKAGERVVVEGLQKIRDGEAVVPRPYEAGAGMRPSAPAGASEKAAKR